MPITQSAKKALRQNARRRTKNIKRKDSYKKAVKEVRKLVLEKHLDEAKAKLAAAYKALDKAAGSKSIKKNKASRLKSRLAKVLAGPKK